MIKKIHVFQNAPSYVENIHDEETGELVGRSFCILDQDTGDLYRYPMGEKVAKERGQELMGIGSVEVASAGSLGRLERAAGGKKR